MNVYKLKPELIGETVISRENFERDTHRKYPWYRDSRTGETVKPCYAVCPGCDNPIQLIGLYKLPPNVKVPYGKHYFSDVPGLANSNREAAEGCLYFKKKVCQPTDRKASINGLPYKALLLLVNEFDRVIYLLEQATQIHFSKNLIGTLLDHYLKRQGYLYSSLNLQNLPWVFAYMTDSVSLFGQKIVGNSALVTAVTEQVPQAMISEDGRVIGRVDAKGKSAFFELNSCFMNHQADFDAENQNLNESMVWVVSTTEAGRPRTIYQQVIHFEPAYFHNLLNMAPERARRQPWLVELAREKLRSLIDS